MGTSKAYGGPGSGLVPSWIDDPAPAAAPTSPGAAPPSLPAVVAPENVAPRPVPRPPDTVGTTKFTGAKRKYTQFVKSGDSSALGGSLRRYVSSSGGAKKAAQRMGASRAAGSRLLGLVRDSIQTSVDDALRVRGLQHLAGQPAEIVYAGLIDVICPQGGPIGEAIARQALLDAIGDRADSGGDDLAGPSPEQLQEFFLDFVIRSIEGRIMSDIGANAVSLPADVGRVIEIQDQVHDFISGCCRNHLMGNLGSISSMTDRQLDTKVSAIYEAAFGLLKSAGEETE